jgi:hypothetical protein
MSTVNAVNSITAPDAVSAASSVDTSSQPSELTIEMNAFGSETGVSLRLLASLPANLGQNVDGAA